MEVQVLYPSCPNCLYKIPLKFFLLAIGKYMKLFSTGVQKYKLYITQQNLLIKTKFNQNMNLSQNKTEIFSWEYIQCVVVNESSDKV